MSDAIEASDLDTSSVTRLGDFCKFLATKFIVKEAQLIDNFLGYFEKPHSYVKLNRLTFGQLLRNLGYFLLHWIQAALEEQPALKYDKIY